MRLAAMVLLAAASGAGAAEAPAWPPPAPVQERMRELQRAIADPQATPAQREAAREALSGLLKSPAGQARGRTQDEKPARPARAAIDPFPSVVEPLPPGNAAAAPPAAARLEVLVPPRPVEPARPLVDPRTGAVLAPSARTAVDPLTGRVLHEVGPGGYVDPTTGRFVPR